MWRSWLSMCCECVFFFFFQAEDGIRDLTVTGVQTCALPISRSTSSWGISGAGSRVWRSLTNSTPIIRPRPRTSPIGGDFFLGALIGRASGGGREEVLVVGGSLKKKIRKASDVQPSPNQPHSDKL